MQLRDAATHVVTGYIEGVFVEESESGAWRNLKYIAEVRVRNVEKGTGLNTGELCYVRYWNRVWIGNGHVPPGAYGLMTRPTKGTIATFYLRDNRKGNVDDGKPGGLDIVLPNGVERKE
jgi:hypothetical protein